MKLIINAIYNYGSFNGIKLIACDIDKNEVTLKDKFGNKKTIHLDLFKRHGRLSKLQNNEIAINITDKEKHHDQIRTVTEKD